MEATSRGEHTVNLAWVVCSEPLRDQECFWSAWICLRGLVCAVLSLHTCPASHCWGDSLESGDPDFSPIILQEAQPRVFHTVGLRTLRRGLTGQAEWVAVVNLVHCSFSSFFFFLFFLVFLFIFETERDTIWAGEGQREGETQNLKQAPGSEVSAQSLTRSSNSRSVRSWPELKSGA